MTSKSPAMLRLARKATANDALFEEFRWACMDPCLQFGMSGRVTEEAIRFMLDRYREWYAKREQA